MSTVTLTHTGMEKAAREIESVCLVGVPTATALSASLCVPVTSVMQFVGSMEMVTTRHLTTKGLTSTDSVNTHLCRYIYHEPLCSDETLREDVGLYYSVGNEALMRCFAVLRTTAALLRTMAPSGF